MRTFLLCLLFTGTLTAQDGSLAIGFDIDDTVLFSRDVFLEVPAGLEGGEYWGWINSHDRNYSMVIPPTLVLINYFRSHGHQVYFITARKPQNGRQVAAFLSNALGFPVRLNQELFFSPSETRNGRKYSTKARMMRKLNLDVYYGDSDSDILAALEADVHPVRIVRHESSWKKYGSSYFGNLIKPQGAENPYRAEDLPTFYNASVGPFGEGIYPIIWEGPGEE